MADGAVHVFLDATLTVGTHRIATKVVSLWRKGAMLIVSKHATELINKQRANNRNGRHRISIPALDRKNPKSCRLGKPVIESACFVRLSFAKELLQSALTTATNNPSGPAGPVRRVLEELPTETQPLLQHLEEVWGYPITLADPLKNIIYRMVDGRADRILLQHDYQDELHYQEFLRLYHELFEETALCKRLFFYRTRVGSRPKKYEFLGAVVIRPFALGLGGRGLGQVGRSIIAPMFGKEPQRGTVVYCISAIYRVFAWNSVEDVKSVPYLQQDTLGARCGQVTLQIMSSFLHKQLDIRELSPAEIREIGGLSTHTPFPLHGLSDEAAFRVVSAMGATPVLYRRRFDRDDHRRLPSRDFAVVADLDMLVELIHIYTDSQLPLMLTFQRDRDLERRKGGDTRRGGVRHAMCVVGHVVSYEEQSEYPRIFKGFRTTTQFLRAFVVHDDAIGPYLQLPIRHGIPEQGRGGRNVDALWTETVQGNVDGVLVPLPEGVHLTAEHVIKALNSMLPKLAVVYGDHCTINLSEPSHSRESMHRALSDSEAIASIYLDLSDRFRLNVATSELQGTDDDTHLSEVLLPEYVWVVELTTADYVRGDAEDQMLGFILIDASASSQSVEPFLAIRLPGLFIHAGPTHKHGWILHACSDSPFTHLCVRNFQRDGSILSYSEKDREATKGQSEGPHP